MLVEFFLGIGWSGLGSEQEEKFLLLQLLTVNNHRTWSLVGCRKTRPTGAKDRKQTEVTGHHLRWKVRYREAK